jgi:hypothetical protein
MLINLSQMRRIHAMLNKLNEMAWKIDYVNEVSKGRTSHISDITAPEANSLIIILSDVERGTRERFNPSPAQQAPVKDEKEEANLLRRRILKCCHQMGWYVIDPATNKLILKEGKAILDYDRINAYCIKYSHSHKKLNEHQVIELKGKGGLVFQFEQMENNKTHKTN